MEQKTVAFFSDAQTASRVREELIDNGISRMDISIYEGKDPGMWESIKETFGFADEEDRHLYHEAARKGGVAVVVDTQNCTALERSEALRILRNHNPMDLQGASPFLRDQGWQEPGMGYRGNPNEDRNSTNIDPDLPFEPGQSR